MTFDILEIEMEKTKDQLKLKDISTRAKYFCINGGISNLNGYKHSRHFSSTKTLNKLISKIPLIGDIIIPKEIGEGLFGISFKMKGPSGK